MAKPKRTKNLSDREKWNKVFKGLAQMLQLQQTQLEYLTKDRKFIEDRLKLQYDRWVSEVNTLQDQINQMKKDFTVQEMQRIVDMAKAQFVVGLKQRDAFMFKRKFEDADSELADFIEWFDYLSQKCSKPDDLPRTSEKNSEITALLSEKNFIWNQFKKLEHDTTEQLRRKRTEIEQAKERIQALMMNVEELQVSNTNKDNTIATLKTQMAKFESDSARKSEEITRLSTELDLLKKSGSTSVTPVLRRRTAGKAKLRGTSHGTAQKNTTVMEESQSSQAIEKGRSSRKRKAGDSISGDPKLLEESQSSQAIEKARSSRKRKAGDSISVAPKLFTSSFKVPKVKTSSSPRVT